MSNFHVYIFDSVSIFSPFSYTINRAASHNLNSMSGSLLYAARKVKSGFEVYIPGFPRGDDIFPPKTIYNVENVETALRQFNSEIKPA